MIEELKKQIHDKRLLKERIENMPQRAREFLFTRGQKFRDKTFKDFGYEYPQSWLLFDEDELAEALDDYETSQEIYTLYKMQAESIEMVKNDKKDANIKKVKVLTGTALDMAKKMSLQDEDLVVIAIEKIEGDPLKY